VPALNEAQTNAFEPQISNHDSIINIQSTIKDRKIRNGGAPSAKNGGSVQGLLTSP
jgi:hypothetical protein